MTGARPAVERAAAAPPAEGSARPLGELPTTLAPHPNLLRYFAITSLAAGPFFAFVLVPLYFRYRTLRYEVDDEGITARWGILFRREISLTYSRIQDIHLASNVLERWLGLARIQVQTASGSSAAEMTIQGMREYGAIRDFLYGRMRGAREAAAPATLAGQQPATAGLPAPVADELAGALRAITAELRALRAELPRARSDGGLHDAAGDEGTSRCASDGDGDRGTDPVLRQEVPDA